MKALALLFTMALLVGISGCSNENGDGDPVQPNRNPSAVNLTAPASDSENISPLLTFQWSAANDPDGDRVTYELYNGPAGNSTELIYTGPATSFTPDERFSLHEQYRWKVIAKDGNGGSSESEINSFNTRGALVSQVTADTKFKPRLHGSCVTFDNKLWLIGGSFNTNGLDRTSEVWSSVDGNTWTLAAKDAAFKRRGGHASVVFKGKMWVIGGISEDGIMNDVWASEEGKNWELVTPAAGFPEAVLHTATVFDNKIWVIGGYSDIGYNNDVWFSEDGATWTQAATSVWNKTGLLVGLKVITFNNKLWVIGGVGVWSSADGIQWKQEVSAEEVPALFPRQYHVCIVYDSKIWLISGFKSDLNNDIWYTKDGINWIEVTSSAAFPKRAIACSAVLDDKLWIIWGPGHHR